MLTQISIQILNEELGINNIERKEINIEDEKKSSNIIIDGIYKSFIFIFVFLIFTFNLIAVSISLQCNRDQGFMFRISSSAFAFMFYILYIFVNYLMYRVRLKGTPCNICSNDPFPLF